MSITVWTLSAASAFALLAVAYSHFRLSRALLRRRASVPPNPHPYPSVTMIRPIRGLDVGARENIRALLDLTYPGQLEILFVLDSDRDPAYPLVCKLVHAESPRPSRQVKILLAGSPPPERTGKLNAMLLGVRQATGEFIAFSDSDTRPLPDLLQTLIDALVSNERTGAVFAPIVAVAENPTAGDVAYGLLVNAWYSPAMALIAGPNGEVPFIMGQCMVFRREALDAIGGVGCAEGRFVDDMYIGQCVARAGWRNVMVDAPLRIIIGRMGIGQFLRTFRRWILFSQGGLPADFTRANWFRGVIAWVPWICLAIALVSGHPFAVVVPVGGMLGFTASQIALQRQLGGKPIAFRHGWVPAVLPIIAALVTLSTRVSRSVTWRGRRYTLTGTARLGGDASAAGVR